jgi:hypothetical protein
LGLGTVGQPNIGLLILVCVLECEALIIVNSEFASVRYVAELAVHQAFLIFCHPKMENCIDHKALVGFDVELEPELKRLGSELSDNIANPHIFLGGLICANLTCDCICSVFFEKP